MAKTKQPKTKEKESDIKGAKESSLLFHSIIKASVKVKIKEDKKDK